MPLFKTEIGSIFYWLIIALVYALGGALLYRRIKNKAHSVYGTFKASHRSNDLKFDYMSAGEISTGIVCLIAFAMSFKNNGFIIGGIFFTAGVNFLYGAYSQSLCNKEESEKLFWHYSRVSEGHERQVMITYLIGEIDSLSEMIYYQKWQERGFEFQCWKFVKNPTLLPNEKTELMGSAYTLAKARTMVNEMKFVSDKINGWVCYPLPDSDSQGGPQYVPMSEWLMSFETANLSVDPIHRSN